MPEPRNATPWSEGADAYAEGRPLSDCPYDASTETQDHGEWVVGWWEEHEAAHAAAL